MTCNKSYMDSPSLSVILESISKSALGEAKDHLICPHHKAQMNRNQLLGMLLNSHIEAGILGEIPPVAQRKGSFYLLNCQTCSPCKYYGKEMILYKTIFLFACSIGLAICLALVTKQIQG